MRFCAGGSMPPRVAVRARRPRSCGAGCTVSHLAQAPSTNSSPPAVKLRQEQHGACDFVRVRRAAQRDHGGQLLLRLRSLPGRKAAGCEHMGLGRFRADHVEADVASAQVESWGRPEPSSIARRCRMPPRPSWKQLWEAAVGSAVGAALAAIGVWRPLPQRKSLVRDRGPATPPATPWDKPSEGNPGERTDRRPTGTRR